MEQAKESRARRIGLAVFIVLIFLLALEFLVAQYSVPRWLIILFGVLQASLILWEYMHLSRFLRDEPGESPPR